jgi:hypothetical protein
VTYIDTAGATQTVDPADYIVHLGEGMIEPASGFSWPQTSCQHRAVTDRIHRRLRRGHRVDAGAAAVPSKIRQAILLMAAELWENRSRRRRSRSAAASCSRTRRSAAC